MIGGDSLPLLFFDSRSFEFFLRPVLLLAVSFRVLCPVSCVTWCFVLGRLEEGGGARRTDEVK